MDYKSDVKNEISENSILDFHLSHKVTNNFSFQPRKETPKFIWRYLSNANLLQNTELINLDDYENFDTVIEITKSNLVISFEIS